MIEAALGQSSPIERPSNGGTKRCCQMRPFSPLLLPQVKVALSLLLASVGRRHCGYHLALYGRVIQPPEWGKWQLRSRAKRGERSGAASSSAVLGEQLSNLRTLL
jgi:hypothetical protein